MDREEFIIPRDKLGALSGANRKLLQRVERLFSSNVEVSSSGDPLGEWVTVRGEKSEIRRAKNYILSLCDPEEETVLAYPIEQHDALVANVQPEAEYTSSAVVILRNGDAIIRGTSMAVAAAVSVLESRIERMAEPTSTAVMVQRSLADGFDINETLARTFERHHSDMDPSELSGVPESIKFMMVEQMRMDNPTHDAVFRSDGGHHDDEAHVLAMGRPEVSEDAESGHPAAMTSTTTTAAKSYSSSASRPLLACNFSKPVPKPPKPAATAAAASVTTSSYRGHPTSPPLAMPTSLNSQFDTSTQSQRLGPSSGEPSSMRALPSSTYTTHVSHTTDGSAAAVTMVTAATARPSLWNTPATVSMSMFPGSERSSPPVFPGSSDMSTAIASLCNVIPSTSSSTSSSRSRSTPQPLLETSAPSSHLNAPFLLAASATSGADQHAAMTPVFVNTPLSGHDEFGSHAASSERKATIYPPAPEPVAAAVAPRHPQRVGKGKKSQNHSVPSDRHGNPARPGQFTPLHFNTSQGAHEGTGYRVNTSQVVNDDIGYCPNTNDDASDRTGYRANKTRMLREVSGPAGKRRPVVIDGSNIAMSHGNGEVFSCKGIQLAVEYFVDLGHTEITAFVPNYRQRTVSIDVPVHDQHLLQRLKEKRHLTFTPSRFIRGRHIVSYDDRFILRLAQMNGGVVVSNDQYRDLYRDNAAWRPVIENRLLPYAFVGDIFLPADDPLGRKGPEVDKFLKF